MKLIREAKDNLAVKRYASGSYWGFIEYLCRQRWDTHANRQLNPSAPPLYAQVAHSYWAVQCECREVLDIDFGEDYFCPNCLNLAHEGKARRVIFPTLSMRADIEKVLSFRPNPDNRNWLPGETPEMLKQENIAHGINQI